MDAPIADSVAAVHAATLVLDSHIDIPWPPHTGGGFADDTRRCVDLPKMRRGGVAAGCFAAFVPQARCDPAGHAAAIERARVMLEAIATMGDATTRVCVTAAAIEAAWRDRVPAIVPCVENGHALGADLAQVAALRRLGAVYITLTHNGHNALADSAIPRADLGDEAAPHGGLSAFGRAAIAEMNRHGIVIDVAHASRAAMLAAAEASRTPIVSTHSCMRALCDHPRNLDDDQLRVLRDVGGVVQVTMVPAFVRKGGKVETVTLGDVLDHVDHAVGLLGVEHVGIGSDFDGGGGVTGWRNAGESAAVTAGLLARGYDAAAIGLLWGGNFLRVLRQAEAAAG
jgi:membrane dipeptidase